ncbi:formylglycine-generating enzyme family protein [Sodalinema gerasimenkoae]|uniref:formylglycine-generating enzyme family protein n=1 Tax=Sodalinema gerasimenkoae TaxID=2862348 RepID=UPI001FE8A1BC|nr:formylglycine-generating enzyme family protein [Sodalinema gerasimenkoae]
MISVLGQRLDLTGTEIAEAIWLAGQLSVEGDRHTVEVNSERVEESESDRNGGEDNLQEDSGNDSREDPGSTTEIVPQPGESEEFPPFPEGHYKPIPIPDPAAIPETLQYARALRPLAHKIAVGKPEIVDERATVAQIADTGVWQPVLRAKLELWLDIVVVYDRSPSMCLWGRFAKDLRQLLSRYGQFRDLREWFFDYDASGGVTLRSRNGTVHNPRELLTGDRRRLILIVSDCVAPAWHEGQIRDVVAVWADHCLTVLLQVFPERLWSRTALARATMVLFDAKQSGLASNELTPRPRLYWDREIIHPKHRPPSQIYLPIITLDPEILSDLAGVAVGDRRARIAGIAWDEGDCQPLQRTPNSSPQRDPLEFFRLTASPTAQRLASLLAAAPVINLPIVRLIQRSMLPQSNPAHVAEVLMSRVFTRVGSVTPTLENAESLLYQVRSESVRQQLLENTDLLETVDVIEQVSAYVARRLGKSMEQFKALLRYPQQAKPEEGAFLQAFARVTGTVLRSLGNEFAALAPRPEPLLIIGAMAGAMQLEELEKDVPDGFPPLKVLEYESAVIIEIKDVLKNMFKFEFATLNRNGNDWVIQRRQGEAEGYVEPLDNDVELEMILIPSGTFLMGAPEDEPESEDSERPQRQVTVSQFFMGRYPITQTQWRVVASYPVFERDLDPDPSRFKGDDLPVEQISWLDAIEFCQRLSKQTGQRYRLPSESEWEYACRAGTQTPFYFGETLSSELANYDGTYGYNEGPKGIYYRSTTVVQTFPTNAWGLHDMHGNIWEWCQDDWHDNYDRAPIDGTAWVNANSRINRKVLRGGSWFADPRYCRSAIRDYFNAAGYFYYGSGLRVVCVPVVVVPNP